MVTTKDAPDIENLNPLLDTSKTTADAFIQLKNKGIVKSDNSDKLLGESDTKWYASPNFKSEVYVYTPLDKQYHRYWTSMNIDVQVQDFMGTCELHAPYDSDLMAYWQPIAQLCIVYGSNNGPAKVLFVGRVRGVKQDGYECVVSLQNYGWKFQQDAPAKFVEDNVKNKDGLTILKNIFEVLKIKSYTISENAAKRLKEVGINEDGNLTLNGKEVQEMPDLLDRLKALDKADMTKIMGKDVVTEKAKEDQISWSDVYNLNYTLKYSEPTAVMTELNKSSNYSAGNTVYKNNYAAASTATNVANAIASSVGSTTTANKPFKSDKTTTGTNIYSAIAEVVGYHVKVSSGKGADYISRLYKANADWNSIYKIIHGHQIVGSGMWGTTNGQNLAIRTILYIKKNGWTAQKAEQKALMDEKAAHGDWGAAINSALTWW